MRPAQALCTFSSKMWLSLERGAHVALRPFIVLLNCASRSSAVHNSRIVFILSLRCASKGGICFSLKRGTQNGPKHAWRLSVAHHRRNRLRSVPSVSPGLHFGALGFRVVVLRFLRLTEGQRWCPELFVWLLHFWCTSRLWGLGCGGGQLGCYDEQKANKLIF